MSSHRDDDPSPKESTAVNIRFREKKTLNSIGRSRGLPLADLGVYHNRGKMNVYTTVVGLRSQMLERVSAHNHTVGSTKGSTFHMWCGNGLANPNTCAATWSHYVTWFTLSPYNEPAEEELFNSVVDLITYGQYLDEIVRFSSCPEDLLVSNRKTPHNKPREGAATRSSLGDVVYPCHDNIDRRAVSTESTLRN